LAGGVMRRAAEATPNRTPVGSTLPASLPARPESRADRARRLVYRGRFGAFYFLLAIAAGAALGSLVVLLERGSPAPAPAWSSWEPQGSAERKAAQIADRVSTPYRLPSGNPLVGVTYAGPPTIAGPDGSPLQLRALAVQNPTSTGAEDIDAIPSASNVMYVLCGLGPACSIPEGRPSDARGQLLRREALELALYSFRYIEGIESVIVMLPPRADGQNATAVFLERSDVRAALEEPLSQTLTAPLVPGVGEITAEEGRTIDRFTKSRVYAYRPLQQQDGAFVLFLVAAPSVPAE
jgi:hypothetical protein